MSLHLLPTRAGGAAENMAVDFLLLQRYPVAGAARFRHYEWQRPAFTFGYAQKIAFVREQVRAMDELSDVRVELCRRPTGGGLVDHRADWTYALVIPRGHPLEALRATESYRLVHESVAAALQAQGVPAITKQTGGVAPLATEPVAEGENTGAGGERAVAGAGICFERAEIHDVVNSRTGRKIAGAAQKRNKHGLLFQGSILRPAAGGSVDWDSFHDEFASRLAAALQLEPEEVAWPEFNEDELSALTEQYSSAEWVEFR